MEKKTHFVRDFLQNFIGNSSTMQHHLQSHLHCGNDPTAANHNGILSTAHARKTLETPFTMRNRSDHGPRMIRTWSENDPTTHETVSHPSHRTGRSSTFGDTFCLEKHSVSCICYLSQTHFVRDFLQNSIGNSSTSTTCNPIYIAGTILQLQITMEFCRPHMHEKHWKPHFQCGTDPTMVREWSEHGPRMIRPHTRPSRTRRTAQVDHRRSGTHFVWKDFLQNSIGNSSTSTTCNPIYIAGTILQLQITMEFCRPHMHEKHWKLMRNRSDHGPRMIRPHTRPSRTRRTAEVDHRRVSCICYLSKTHFVRDFLQNSIGNSCTSTTCNPIYVAGTISLTNSFPNELFLC